MKAFSFGHPTWHTGHMTGAGGNTMRTQRTPGGTMKAEQV